MSIKVGAFCGSPTFSEVDHRALLNHVFPESLSDEQVSKPLSKLLGFHNLEEYIDNIELQELASFADEEDSACRIGCIGPSTVLLDNETNVGGQVVVESNRLSVTGQGNFSTIRANCCVFGGKWQYEVCLSTCGLMQIGWCTLSNNFVREKGVGDTQNSYAFDGARVRKWNIQSLPYGEAWDVEDIISCCIDCNEGTVSFSRNGVDMGVAFDCLALGAGLAYFPAVSLSSGESVTLNFGGTPFIYPVEGYASLQSTPVRGLACAQRFLNHFERLVPLAVETSKDERSNLLSSSNRSRKASCWLIASHLLNKLAPHIVNPFIVEKLLLNFLLRFCDTSAVDANQSYVICVLQFMWALLEEECVHLCLDQIVLSLITTYRFAPVVEHLAHQKNALCLLSTLVGHAPTRLHILNSVFFDNAQFLAIFNSKNVASTVNKLCDDAASDSEFDYCSHFLNYAANCSSAESVMRRLVFGPLMSCIEKDVEELERYQDEIMFHLLCDDDHNDSLKTSRSVFFRKLRELIHEEQVADHSISENSASAMFLPLFHRLVSALRRVWYVESSISEELPSFDAIYIPVDMFCNELPLPSYNERLGGQLAYLKKTFKEELASLLKLDRRAGPPDRERRSFFALKRVSEDPLVRSRRLFRERCADELNTRSKQLSSLGQHSDSTSTAGSGSNPRGSYALISLLDIVDSVVLLFQVCVHKQFAKYTNFRQRTAEYHAGYTSTLEKLRRCPEHRADIRDALNLARDIFSKRLHDFRAHFAWILSVVFCARKAHDIHWLLRVLLNTFQENGGGATSSADDAPLFRFLPEVYAEAVMNAFHILHEHFQPMLPLEKELADWRTHTLGGVAQFLIRAYTDRRVNSRDLKDALLHCLTQFVSSVECLAALEGLAPHDAECFVRLLLAPYDNRSWAQTNLILVRLWKGCGFGFRYTKLPHLSASSDFLQHQVPSEQPLPSVHYQRVIKRMLEQEEELSWRLIDSLLTQLNWAFSEFVGAVQELQQTGAGGGSTGIGENRQLKMCVTCFDIAVSLLRVLEMVASLLPELFVDKSNHRPQSDLFASRLFQIVGQVLNRLATRSSLLDCLLASQPSGLYTVDRYLILAPVAGILIQLIRNSSAAKLLLKESSFEAGALHRLLGREPLTEDHKTTTSFSFISAAQRFSFFNYPDAISSDEVCQLEELIALVDQEAKCMSEAERTISDDDLCSICCASELSAVFKPCEHQSCRSCITHQMMNKPECFFCKAVVLRVEDLKGNPIRWK